MKTIEEKAKAYDEVREKIALRFGSNVAKEIFSEFEMSENERIRKALIRFHKSSIDIDGIKGEDIIAWLEKQGKSSDQIHYWTEEEIEPIISDYLRGAEHYGGMIGRLRCLKPKSLEKQGEQKTQAKSAIEIWKDMRLEVYQQASGNRHESNYSDDTTKMFSLNDIDEIIEKISEQKSADKVEPKFNIEDWISNGDYTWKIVEIKPLDYTLQSQDGNIIDYTIPYVDKYFHSFTIQDAKNGDVLYSPTHRLIWVYKDKDKYYAATNLNYIESISFDGYIVIPSDVCPANRVQRSILLQKMEESGYMWDEKKNILIKKIKKY